MSYIGKEPTVGNFQKCDAISVVNGQAAYTLQVNSVNVSPESVNHCLVSLNGILQSPTDSFTVSGSTLTFASNLSTGDVIDFVMILGNVLDLGVPSDNTVSASKLTNDIISGQTELATEPADTDEFLVSDAGTIKRIDYSLIKGGGITVADQWRLTADTNAGTDDVVSSNWERNDSTGFGYITGISESSGIFSFPSTGYYLLLLCPRFRLYQGDYMYCDIQVTTDNSSYTSVSRAESVNLTTNSEEGFPGNAEYIVDVTDTSNVKVRFTAESEGTATLFGNTDNNETWFQFIRLGDT